MAGRFGGRLVRARKAPAGILRKLTQPLYDTNVLEGGVAQQRLGFFELPIGQNMPVAGVPKTIVDTNMTQASQLGTPQKFWLRGYNFEFFNLEPDDIANTAPDLVLLYEQSLFTFTFGNNRPWLQIPLSQIPQGCALTGTLAFGDDQNAVEAAYLHQGEASVAEYYNFTVARRPIRINTNEPFSAEITWPNGAVTWNTANDQRVRVYLIGHLFAAI